MHPPAVHKQHRPLQPFGDVAAFDMPIPVGHIEHGKVIKDQQQECDGAQGINIVASVVHAGLVRSGMTQEYACEIATDTGMCLSEALL